jgi:glyoxylate carboligase
MAWSLKVIKETTKTTLNLPDMQVIELTIQARVKWMHTKENKKHYIAQKTAIVSTPQKPQRIKEMPNFVDSKMETEYHPLVLILQQHPFV